MESDGNIRFVLVYLHRISNNTTLGKIPNSIAVRKIPSSITVRKTSNSNTLRKYRTATQWSRPNCAQNVEVVMQVEEKCIS